MSIWAVSSDMAASNRDPTDAIFLAAVPRSGSCRRLELAARYATQQAVSYLLVEVDSHLVDLRMGTSAW